MALSSNFGKRPLAKIGEKMIDLTSKLRKINDIKHNNGSKIYSQNQFYRLFYAMHKCLSITLLLAIVSIKKKVKFLFLCFTFPNWENRH